MVGPLYKILAKLTKDLGSFIILYVIIGLCFALLGNINFVAESEKFEDFIHAILTVVDTSLGNFNFNLDDHQEMSDDDESIKKGSANISLFQNFKHCIFTCKLVETDGCWFSFLRS